MPRCNIGVAISVPEPYAAELRDWREQFGDQQARLVPTHVTLLPPTGVPAEALPEIERHLQSTAKGESPFELMLRGTGTFRPLSPVTFVSLVAGIPECERLEAKVRSGPLQRPLKFNYHPHVTVAHDVDDVALDKAFHELASFEAAFRVERFTLFEEGADSAWRPISEFRLGS